MKKFNLVKEIIAVDRPALMAAISSAKPFGITIEGAIHRPPYRADSCYIYQGCVTPSASLALTPAKPKSLAELMGTGMQVVEADDRVLIKASRDWQTIMGYNLPNADYDDTTGDGIAEFSDGELEDIGWHATEFSINYRDLVEQIEAHCDGTLLCIETEGEHYQFSGMGFIRDMPCARKRCFDYCVERITQLLEEDESYRDGDMTDDEEEALEFFGISIPAVD